MICELQLHKTVCLYISIYIMRIIVVLPVGSKHWRTEQCLVNKFVIKAQGPGMHGNEPSARGESALGWF